MAASPNGHVPRHSGQQEIHRRLGDVLARLNAGDLTGAMADCEALRRTAPDDPAVLQLHATVALRTGQAAQARLSIQRSLALRAGHVPSLILAARIAMALGAADQAVPPLREAVARAPELSEPALLLCTVLLQLNDPSLDAALAAAASRHGKDAAAWLELGRALQRAGRAAAALAAFDRVAEADPTNAAAQFGRGLALRDTGRLPQAHAALTRAVTLDGASAGAWFALGLTCQDLHDEAGAAAAFRAALRVLPDFAEAAVNLGIALQRLGDLPAALDAYRDGLRIRPDTLGRIAQALTAAGTGMLVLDPAALRRMLGA